MSLTFNIIESAFLAKVTEFEFLRIPEENRNELLDGYLLRAATAFAKVCEYDLTAYDDVTREFTSTFSAEDVDELIDILSEGMLVQWFKPYIYKQELLENQLNTSDFTSYSPAELLLRVGSAYERVQSDYTQMIREYSYNHGDLDSLYI